MKNKENLQEVMLVGITGGIGAGKTTVSNYLSEKGFKVLNADNIAKDILSNNLEVKQKIIQTFGNDSYKNGKYNSSFIASCVFEDNNNNNSNKKLALLNQIVHPIIIQELIDQIELLAFTGEKIIFVDIPLLFELNLEEGFDYVITVFSNDDIRLRRIKERSNLSEEQIKNRIKQQISQEEKIKNSDFVLENNGSYEELYKGADFLLSILETMT